MALYRKVIEAELPEDQPDNHVWFHPKAAEEWQGTRCAYEGKTFRPFTVKLEEA
jgi:hypothetical protein